MPYNGSGTFVRLYSWEQDRLNGIAIRSDKMDAEMDGFATGLSNAITKDGQTTPSANLPMGSFILTGLGAGSAAGHSVRYEQVLRNAGAAWTAEVAVASAGTCDILGAASEKIEITGTTTITSFGTGTNRVRLVRFAAALTLTHNATTLILPGGANITTAAGDTCLVVSDGSSNARVMFYQRADGLPLDADLATIAGLTPTSNNFIQSVSSAWASRTPAQALTSLLTAFASVGQLPFPATQSASADANTLDDYEEGDASSTVTIEFGGANAGLTWNRRTARYVKIGRFVLVAGEMLLSAKGSSTGTARIIALPFTSRNASNYFQGGHVFHYSSMASLSYSVGLRLHPNSTSATFVTGGTTAITDLTHANFTDTSRFMFSLVYEANA